jgi:hypothetical protein
MISPSRKRSAMTTRERAKITQTTGARVKATGEQSGLGTVVGHYDDDSVFIDWDYGPTLDRWAVDYLRLAA